MIKKVILSLLFSGFSLLANQPAGPKNTIFLWDFHSVIAQRFFIGESHVKPKQDVAQIIKKLKDLGYTHHLGSNMKYKTYTLVTDPIKRPQFADIFAQFDLSKSQVKSCGLAKPSAAFFLEYLRKNDLDLSQTKIIFIDDKVKNVDAAKKLGFDTIQFKNAKQLVEDLAAKGISIDQQQKPKYKSQSTMENF